MNALRNRLREGDPAARETGLDEAHVAHLRDTILRASPAPRTRIGMAVPLALVLLCVSAGSAWLVRTSVPTATSEIAAPSQRQLQFATAGGTRVIWFFNPDFDVR